MISHLDHLVLTVTDMDETILFYETILGMTAITFGQNRRALRFGNQKINCHQLGSECRPNAQVPTPGSADLCFISTIPIEQVVQKLMSNNIPVIEGAVKRTGAVTPLMSVYFRDPDKTLIEVSCPIE